jgi:hypothetical protein
LFPILADLRFRLNLKKCLFVQQAWEENPEFEKDRPEVGEAEN